jgi:hypothetical protein
MDRVQLMPMLDVRTPRRPLRSPEVSQESLDVGWLPTQQANSPCAMAQFYASFPWFCRSTKWMAGAAMVTAARVMILVTMETFFLKKMRRNWKGVTTERG